MEFDTIDVNNEAQINLLLELFMDASVRNVIPTFHMFWHFQDFIEWICLDEVNHLQRLVRLENEYIGWISRTIGTTEHSIRLDYAVGKSKRGKGYGRRMIEDFISACSDEIELIEVFVEEDSIYSKRIIESLNFEKSEGKNQYFYQIPRQNRIN